MLQQLAFQLVVVAAVISWLHFNCDLTLTMTKHAHRAINLSNEMSILLGCLIKHGAFRMVV